MSQSTAQSASDVVAVSTRSHPLAVREMLADLMGGLTLWVRNTDSLHCVELVLAEALNNVYEHACGYEDGIYFAAEARFEDPCLVVEITDHGHPMPGLTLPKQALPDARLPDTDVPVQALPEGGWGWMLIRDLTEEIRYRRRPQSNHLLLRIKID